MTDMALRVSDVACGYSRSNLVLGGVSLEARTGCITAVVGPNGAGKSTLLKAVMGELPLARGEIRLEGRDLRGIAPCARVAMGLGYVPQLRCVFPRLTVAENLEMGAYVLRSGDRERSIQGALERFPVLAAVRNRRAGVLSGGEQRLLGVARAWVAHPHVLLLDEPTSALSPKATEQLWQELVSLTDEDVALLVVEQRTRRTLEISDWAYVLASGRNVVDGAPDELQERYDLGAIFMGQPPLARQNQAPTGSRPAERADL